MLLGVSSRDSLLNDCRVITLVLLIIQDESGTISTS